jgi:hypothetical protein
MEGQSGGSIGGTSAGFYEWESASPASRRERNEEEEEEEVVVVEDDEVVDLYVLLLFQACQNNRHGSQIQKCDKPKDKPQYPPKMERKKIAKKRPGYHTIDKTKCGQKDLKTTRKMGRENPGKQNASQPTSSKSPKKRYNKAQEKRKSRTSKPLI